ncbi:MAG: anthranilate synthase component I family protein [Saprospiraceae bacterium]
MRQVAHFQINNLATAKKQLLHWASRHPVCVYLDSNSYPQQQHRSWECLVAVGAADSFQATAGQAFPGLQAFAKQKQDWLFGFLGYDLKNEVEALQSQNPDGLGLPDLYFFQPEMVVGISSENLHQLTIFSLIETPERVWAAIQNTIPQPADEPAHSRLLHPRLPKADYLQAVEAVRGHIVEGDVYELNLCQEFYAENSTLIPLPTFERLNARAQAPFAAYLRKQNHYLLCASPERFLRKTGDLLVSQPIKGTRRRHSDPAEDALIREALRTSIKDRAENVMIVDLVRNDLARHCQPGSVQVEELFGIYGFQTVYQMISTITGTLRPGTHPVVAIRDAFPMGSMTGAPKVMAMELIEHYERSRRGLYSGAVGYFTPAGDFDFNVVIRSILYNAANQYISCQVGGAIVYDSTPEEEYQECLLKVQALLDVLGARLQA